MPKSYVEKYEEPEEASTIFENRLNDLKSEIKVQLPCKVASVDYDNNQVSVEILDYDSDYAGNLINYPIIPNVPIRQSQDSGLAYIRLPIQVGDIGTIEFFDSNIDDVVSTGIFDYDHSEDWHSINNGLFTNGFLPSGKTFTYDHESKIVIGTKTGKFIFKINNNDELEIVAEKININTTTSIDINATSGISISSGSAMNISASSVNITGDMVVSGEVTANNKSLSTHTHKDSMGGSTTPPD